MEEGVRASSFLHGLVIIIRMAVYRARAGLLWQAVGYAVLFWGLFLANLCLAFQLNTFIFAAFFPCVIWIVMGFLSLIGVNNALGVVSIDEAGIRYDLPIGSKSMRWSEVTHIDRNGIADADLVLHSANLVLEISVGLIDPTGALRAEILKHQCPQATMRKINMAAERKGTILFIGLVAFGLLVLAYFTQTNPDPRSPSNAQVLAAMVVGCSLLLLLCLLPTMHYLYISEDGIRKAFFWGAEKRMPFSDVRRCELRVSYSQGSPSYEVMQLSNDSTSMTLTSYMSDFGWARDMVLQHVDPARVDDRRQRHHLQP